MEKKKALFLFGLLFLLYNCFSFEPVQAQAINGLSLSSNFFNVGGSISPETTKASNSSSLYGTGGTGDVMRLTTGTKNQSNYIWNKNPVVTLGKDFHVSVWLNMGTQAGDGIAFVMQPNSNHASAVGGQSLNVYGNGNGYFSPSQTALSSIQGSFALEFDTYLNLSNGNSNFDAAGDVYNQHLAPVYPSNADSFYLPKGSPIMKHFEAGGANSVFIFDKTSLTDNSWRQFDVDYEAATRRLSYSLKDLDGHYTISENKLGEQVPTVATITLNPRKMLINLNKNTRISDTRPFYLGFTGSSGDAVSNNRIIIEDFPGVPKYKFVGQLVDQKNGTVLTSAGGRVAQVKPAQNLIYQLTATVQKNSFLGLTKPRVKISLPQNSKLESGFKNAKGEKFNVRVASATDPGAFTYQNAQDTGKKDLNGQEIYTAAVGDYMQTSERSDISKTVEFMFRPADSRQQQTVITNPELDSPTGDGVKLAAGELTYQVAANKASVLTLNNLPQTNIMDQPFPLNGTITDDDSYAFHNFKVKLNYPNDTSKQFDVVDARGRLYPLVYSETGKHQLSGAFIPEGALSMTGNYSGSVQVSDEVGNISNEQRFAFHVADRVPGLQLPNAISFNPWTLGDVKRDYFKASADWKNISITNLSLKLADYKVSARLTQPLRTTAGKKLKGNLYFDAADGTTADDDLTIDTLIYEHILLGTTSIAQTEITNDWRDGHKGIYLQANDDNFMANYRGELTWTLSMTPGWS